MAAEMKDLPKNAADQNLDYMFKFLVIGNSEVGKTSFLYRHLIDLFTSAYVPTILDFKVKAQLRIWEASGQENYLSVTNAYFRGTAGFILMYDVTNEESFNSVHHWITDVEREHEYMKTYSCPSHEKLPAVCLAGNKCDINDDDRQISYQRGKNLADKLNVPFFETSAKAEPGGINVGDVFEKLVDEIWLGLAEMDDVPKELEHGVGLGTENDLGSSGRCRC